jgi:hypothetical protein
MNTIVRTLHPLIRFNSLFLSYLNKSLPDSINENEYKTESLSFTEIKKY